MRSGRFLVRSLHHPDCTFVLDVTMIKTLYIVLLTSLSFAQLGCVKDEEAVIVGKKKNAPTPSTQVPSERIQDQRNSQVETAAIPVSLDERKLQQTFQVVTSSLTYKFSYLGKNQEGPIEFVQNIARIRFENLPVNQSGDLKFQVFEDGKFVIFGEKKALTLQAGRNQEKLTLVKVESGAELDIDLDVEPEDGNFSNPQPNPFPGPQQPNPQPGPQQPNPEPEPQQPNPEPQPNPGQGGSEPQLPLPNVPEAAKATMGILLKHCSECHHPGRNVDLTSFPLKIGSQTNPKSVMDFVITTTEGADRTMPPAPRDALTAEELAVLKAYRATLP